MMASGTGQSIARSVSGISHFSEHRGADNESQASKNPADKADKASKVNVIVRLRPPASQGEDISEVFVADKTNVTVRDPLSRGRMEHHFVFDQVFSPDHGQEAVFEVVAKPLVDHLLSGFNSCCFAYGQTGSGKTHSVFGEGNKEQRGLLARSIEYLFDKIEAQSSQKEVGMVVSFLEIYLDQVRDLGRFYLEGQAEEELPVSKTSSNPKLKNSQSGRSLSRPSSAHGEKEQSNHPSSRPSSGKGAERSRTSGNISNPDDAEDLYVRQDLPIHETPQGLVYVEDLSLIPVTNIREVLSIANLGVQMRATFETRLNARSSRSHTIFSVSIVQKSKSDPKSGVVGSVLNFVDLAGSERLARSQSEGRRFQEAVIINSSLSALGKVVLALASDKARHIPYRDSKLTRILQNSLGGNSYTTLLTTVDPSAANYEESLNSLFFADRCQNVQNKPVQNVARSDEGNDKAISKLTLEIVNLKHQLEVQGAMAQGPSKPGGQGQGPAPPGASGARSMIQRQRTGGTGAMSMAMSMASAAQEDQGPDLDDVLEQAAGKLASERRMAFQLEARIQEAQDSLDKARIEQLRRDDVKRKESNAIKNSIKALQLELQKTQQRFDFLRAELDADAANLTQDVHRRARGLKHQRMSMTDTFSRALVFSAQIGEDGVESVAKANIETACAKIEKDFSSFSKRLERSFATEQSQLPTPYEQWFQEQEARAERTLAFRAKCIGECAEKRKKIQGELVSAWDLAKRLHKILDALVAGVPNDHRSKVRRVDPTIPRVTLPVVGSVPSSRRPSKAESVEETPRTLAGKIASLLVGLPDPPLRADAKEIREQLCKQEATPMSAPSGPSPGPSGPSVPSGPGCRPGSRPGSAPPARPPSAGFARSASSECESVVASGEDVSWWDAEGFAREFCDVKEPGADAAAEAAEARAVLESLDAARLRALCTSLRRRASMTASEKAAEQAKLAEEVARRLSRTETVDRIRDLEREIAKYREQQVGQQEEQLNLECVLKHGCESWSSLGA